MQQNDAMLQKKWLKFPIDSCAEHRNPRKAKKVLAITVQRMYSCCRNIPQQVAG
jgi:hypothetical protein